MKFQSGNSLTANDVVFSFERMRAIGQGLSYLFGFVESVEALDAHTVRFNLQEPYSPFVASLVRLPIVDMMLVMENLGDGDGDMKDWGSAFLSANGAGTGAYVVQSHNPQDETIMVRNSDYFLPIPAEAPDTVRLRYGLEPATVRTLIAQGEHDISSQWLPPEVKKALADDGAQLLVEGGTGAFYFKMNTTKPPLDDVNCRLALAKAFDYSSVLKLVEITDTVSEGSATTGAIPVGMFGANSTDQVLARELEAARGHLADCKYDPSEFSIEVSWIAEVPLEERLALLMQANLAELGVSSEIKKVPWALFADMVSNPENTPHVSQIFVTAVTGDPDTLLYGMYHSSAAGSWQSPEYLNDAAVDEHLDAGRTANSDEGREIAYRALNDRLMAIRAIHLRFDRQSVFVARAGISAPTLSDPEHAFGLDAMGFTFRLIEVE